MYALYNMYMYSITVALKYMCMNNIIIIIIMGSNLMYNSSFSISL